MNRPDASRPPVAAAGGTARTSEDEVDPSDVRQRVQTVVAVLTYRRTHLLPPLLSELVVQAGVCDPPADVVVVDNDPAGSAAGVVGEWSGRGVRYAHEPRPGISAARNRALVEAAGADLLVFIDDDELPTPGWLGQLTGAWRRWGCAAVVGPVPARLMGPTEPWVLGSGMFDRPRHATGRRMHGAGAGNLLLDLSRVRALGLFFDERFGLTGGEDTLFTRQLVRAGEEIRWCDEAEAVELIPADRLHRSWVLTRCFRTGSAYSSAELHLAAGGAARGRLRMVFLAKAGGRIALAAGRWLGAAVRGDVAGRARAHCTLASYAGLTAGVFGHVHQEYARTTDTDRAEELPGVPVR
jgi:succinoglycan biosynthesis protein ExoM